MQSKADRKKQFILEQSRVVFMEKGYQSVTMTDLVEACGISRGGLYRYFKSTKEIFTAMLQVNQQLAAQVLKKGMDNNISATVLLEGFLENEKDHVLQQQASLTTAVYEFYFNHKHHMQENWLQDQFDKAENILTDLVTYGINQGEFHPNEAEETARNILFLLEGLRVSAQVMGVNEKMMMGQFHLLKKQLLIEKGGE